MGKRAKRARSEAQPSGGESGAKRARSEAQPSGANEIRCGVAALLGRPNAGKSTLLNALLGTRLAIITAKAQTTRGRIQGVLTRPGLQLILYDTPGINRGQSRFNLLMTATALRTARDADVRLLLLDARARWDEPEERAASLPPPLLLVRTKCDLQTPQPVPRPERFAGIVETAATSGQGLEALVERIAQELPESPPLYEDDYLTDRPWRFLAAEQIREVGFERLRDELPYALAVEVEEWKESEQDVRIRANLLVERESQKGIAIGAGGAMLRSIGSEARRRLAESLGKTVHLQLHVKLDRNWSHRPKRARELGYLD